MGCNQSKSLRPKRRKSKVAPAKTEQCTTPIPTKKVFRPYFYGNSSHKLVATSDRSQQLLQSSNNTKIYNGTVRHHIEDVTVTDDVPETSGSATSVETTESTSTDNNVPAPVATGKAICSSTAQSQSTVIYNPSTMVEELKQMLEKFPGDKNMIARVKGRESLEHIQRRRFESRANEELDMAYALQQKLRVINRNQSQQKEKLIKLTNLKKEKLSGPSTIHLAAHLNAPIREVQKSYRHCECKIYRVVGEITTREAKADFYLSLLKEDDDDDMSDDEDMVASDCGSRSIPEESQQDLEEYEQGIFPSETNMSPAAVAYRLDLEDIM